MREAKRTLWQSSWARGWLLTALCLAGFFAGEWLLKTDQFEPTSAFIGVVLGAMLFTLIETYSM
jgi:hypothetical protein